MENNNGKILSLIHTNPDIVTGDDEIKWLKGNLRRIIKSEDETPDRVKLLATQIAAARAYLDILKYQNNLPIVESDNNVNDNFTLELDDADPAAIAAEIRRRLQA